MMMMKKNAKNRRKPKRLTFSIRIASKQRKTISVSLQKISSSHNAMLVTMKRIIKATAISIKTPEHLKSRIKKTSPIAPEKRRDNLLRKKFSQRSSSKLCRP